MKEKKLIEFLHTKVWPKKKKKKKFLKKKVRTKKKKKTPKKLPCIILKGTKL